MKLTAFFAEDDSIIAKEVWRHFENIKMYVEPFFNFGSVLISRPGKKFKNEIVNDYDGHIANVWRSIKFKSDEVAKCWDLINTRNMFDVKNILLEIEPNDLRQKLINDPEYCNPQLASYWLEYASNWNNDDLKYKNSKENANFDKREMIGWFQERLQNVKVVSGDWTRVMGGNWRTARGNCGVFLDPPSKSKLGDNMDTFTEDYNLTKDVLDWCKENGKDPLYKIAICDYDGKYKELEELSWNKFTPQEKVNSIQKVVWFSPACVKNFSLFDLI